MERGTPSRKRGQGIVKISKLFEKYQKSLKAPQSVVVDAYCTFIQEQYGIQLKKAQCLYNPNTRTLTLSMTGVIKSELLLHKKEALSSLKSQLGELNAPKVII